ncbi:MAG TPA: ABC transporter substrate-binding protein [Acetobacteraceae bacterium]|nr:ABC transporter substrate-binding protein [Acetobacteraceae bacterium]
MRNATMIGRRRIIQATGAGVALPFLTTGRARANPPAQLRVAFFVETKPTMIAKGEGWFDQMTGTKIQWSEAGSGAEVNTGIAAGSFDIGLAIGSSGTAAGLSQGLPYELIGMVDNIGPAEDMVVRKTANIHVPADFKGKKVATPFGSTSHFRLLGFLAVNKLTQADVTVLDMTPNAMVAAWHRGDIDAGYVWAPAKSKLLEEGGVSYPTYKELDAAGYVIADLIVATKTFSREYPDAVVGFLKAYGRALALWNDKPDEAAQIVAKQAGVTADVAKRDMQEYDFVAQKDQLSPNWLGTPGQPGKFAAVLKRTADFLVQQKSIRSAPALEAFQKGTNTEFLQRAVG